MPAPLDVTGERYGKLIAIRFLYSKNKKRVWEWKCDCGNTISRRLADVKRSDRKSAKTRSCGCASEWYRKGLSRHNTLPYGKAAFRSLYARYKASARNREIDWLIDRATFRELTTGDCHYCGEIPMMLMSHNGCNGVYHYNGLDRLDNDGPYTPDNVVPCCGRCNRAKQTMSVDKFREWIIKVHRNFANE